MGNDLSSTSSKTLYIFQTSQLLSFNRMRSTNGTQQFGPLLSCF
uniref:Uncharacterized protein n=1 Tax=Arundo donax TaxID=35708 RepID=A0A0A9AD38_ARUDO